MVTISSVLEDIQLLDAESRAMVVEILKKRQIEERRDEIARSAEQSLSEYREGKLKPDTAEVSCPEMSLRKSKLNGKDYYQRKATLSKWI